MTDVRFRIVQPQGPEHGKLPTERFGEFHVFYDTFGGHGGDRWYRLVEGPTDPDGTIVLGWERCAKP